MVFRSIRHYANKIVRQAIGQKNKKSGTTENIWYLIKTRGERVPNT